MVCLEGEEVVEDLALGDLRRLVYADPVAQTGRSGPRCPEHDVLLGDGQGRIDVGQAEQRGVSE